MTAPFGMPKVEIERFLLQKNEWILKKLSEQRVASEKFSDFFSLKRLPYHGESLEYVFISNIKSAKIVDNVIQLPIKTNKSREQIITDFYKRTAKKELLERLNLQATRCNLQYNSFRLTNAKSKWGSCDAHRVISLNWRLIMYSTPVIDYVIIHELCHTVHMNHSKEFWAKVSQHVPHMNVYKKYLKLNGQLISMFR